MTAHIATYAPAATIHTSEEKQRSLGPLTSLIALGGVVTLWLYGQSYYRLSQANRPLSARHHLLSPTGGVGISMALMGMLLLCGIFLYPLRKRWGWLQRQGSSRHWLDHHIVFGVAAPVCIAFHSSFKFHGLAGVAFWVMVAVSVSGLIGRYLYAQVLRETAVATSSLAVLQAVLEHQRIVPPADLRRLFLWSAPNRVSHWSAFSALGYIVLSDLILPFRVARLRLRHLEGKPSFRTCGGLLSTGNAQFEGVIKLACKQALLSRRLVFLSHTQRVFRLWHVVHKPFSYAFAVLALVHIGVAMLFGFI